MPEIVSHKLLSNPHFLGRSKSWCDPFYYQVAIIVLELGTSTQLTNALQNTFALVVRVTNHQVNLYALLATIVHVAQ